MATHRKPTIARSATSRHRAGELGAPRLLIVAALALALAVITSCNADADHAGSSSAPQRTTTSGVPSDATTSPAGTDSSVPEVSSGQPVGASDATTTTARERRSGSTTSLLPAKSGVPDSPQQNSKGDPIRLDETALLACANNQIASVVDAQGDPDEASGDLVTAAARAGASAVPEVKAAAPSLEAAANGTNRAATMSEFLALCTERGFEY